MTTENEENVTRYRAIARVLLSKIERGEWPDGLLPGRRDLMDTFSASRRTIDSALDILEQGRWIKREPKRRPRILASESAFSDKLGIFLSRSGFREPRSSQALRRFDVPASATGAKKRVVELAAYVAENWAEHAVSDIEHRAALAALKELRSGDMRIFDTLGIEELKKAICRRVARWGIKAKPSEVCIVSRRLQAYRLLSDVLIGPTTELWYPAVSLVKHCGIADRHTRRRCELPIDENSGVRINDFMISRSPKVLMIEPDEAVPMGVTLPELERGVLVDEARKSGAFIIEDIFCREVTEGEFPPPMMSLDPRKESVVLIGGHPLWLSPLATHTFIIANEQLIEHLLACARRDYLIPEVFGQVVAAKIDELKLHDEMISRFLEFQRAHIARVDEILRETFGDRFTWRMPAGFGTIWLDLSGVDLKRIHRHREDVNFMPGWYFGEKEARHVALRYTLRLEDIREGVRRLACLIDEWG